MKLPSFRSHRRLMIVLVIALVAVLVFVVWTVAAFNGLVAKKTAIEAQWAQVENAIQLKVGKVPQLVALARGYAEFERSTLLNLTELRTRWMNATQIPEQANLSNLIALAVADLRTTVENYPYLQSETLLVGALDEIAEAENMIALVAGDYYGGLWDVTYAIGTEILNHYDAGGASGTPELWVLDWWMVALLAGLVVLTVVTRGRFLWYIPNLWKRGGFGGGRFGGGGAKRKF